MRCNLNILIQSPIIKKWSQHCLLQLGEFVDSQKFTTITSLLISLNLKSESELKSHIIMLELEDELFIEHVNQILSFYQNIKLLGIGYPKEINTVKKLLGLGIKGFIDISVNEFEVLNAVKTLNEGRIYLSPNYLNQLLIDLIQNEITGTNNNHHFEKRLESTINSFNLSKKELTVLEYLLKGYSYKQIASLSGVTTFAINQRVKSLYKKCGVRSRNELSYLLLK